MIKVIIKKYVQSEVQTLKKIFSLAGIEQHYLSFIDISDSDASSLGKDLIFFAMGKESTRWLVKTLVSMGTLDKSLYVGNDIIDVKSRFIFYNISMNVVEMMTSKETKTFMWARVKSFASHYKSLPDFNDCIDQINGDDQPKKPEESLDKNEESNIATPEVKEPLVSGQDLILPDSGSRQDAKESDSDDSLAAAKSKAVLSDGIAEYVSEDTAQLSDPNNTALDKLSDVTHDLSLLLKSLSSMVNMSDPALEKSLSRYKKFILATPNGEISVYPTARIPPTDVGLSISFKDLILLLKFADTMGASKITFNKVKQEN